MDPREIVPSHNAALPGELAPIAPMAATVPTFFAERRGPQLVVQKDAPLPDVCVKCGERGRFARKRRRFIWYPRWILALLAVRLFGWIAMAILYGTLRKVGWLEMPLCPRCERRWRGARVAAVASVLALLVLGFGGISLLASGELGIGVLPAVLLTVLGFGAPFAAQFGLVRPRTVLAARADDRTLTLIGVHPDAADAIVAAGGQPAPALPAVAQLPPGSIQ